MKQHNIFERINSNVENEGDCMLVHLLSRFAYPVRTRVCLLVFTRAQKVRTKEGNIPEFVLSELNNASVNTP